MTPHPGRMTSELPTQAMRPGTANANTANMQTRINQLESLVLDLMHQNESSPSVQESQATNPHPTYSPLPAIQSESQAAVSPSPSDYGTISIRRERLSYVGSSHWAAVLDSITELRNHFAHEEDTSNESPDFVSPATNFPKPQLLYSGTIFDTPTSIIKAIPPRSVVDRLVSRYFNVLDIAPGMSLEISENPVRVLSLTGIRHCA
jgi:hypothetical protein